MSQVSWRWETLDLDGSGSKSYKVWDLKPSEDFKFQSAVTDIPCPVNSCEGRIVWEEDRNENLHRVCTKCNRRFFALGTFLKPRLALVKE